VLYIIRGTYSADVEDPDLWVLTPSRICTSIKLHIPIIWGV